MALIFPSFSPVFGTFSNTTSGRKAHSFKCHSYKTKSFKCKWQCTYFCIFLQPLVSHFFEFHAIQTFLKPQLKTFLKSLKLIKAQNNYTTMQKKLSPNTIKMTHCKLQIFCYTFRPFFFTF